MTLKTKTVFLLTAAVALAVPAWATDKTWTGEAGSYTNWYAELNWDPLGHWEDGDNALFTTNEKESYTVTIAGTEPIIAGSVTVTGDTEYTFEFYYNADVAPSLTMDTLIVGTADGAGSLIITGGDVTIGSSTRETTEIGKQGGDGSSLTITGGTVSFGGIVYVGGYDGETGHSGSMIIGGEGADVELKVTFGDIVSIGDGRDSEGSMTINSGEVVFSSFLYVGDIGTGTLTINGGTTTFGDVVNVGDTGTGELTINGGANTFEGEVNVGTGKLTITGDGENEFKGAVYVGYGDGGESSLIISGSTTTFDEEVDIGYSGAGALTITGGETTFDNTVRVGYGSSSSSVEITGGEVEFKGQVVVGKGAASSITIGTADGDNEGVKTTWRGEVHIQGGSSLTIYGGENEFSHSVYLGGIQSGEEGSVAGTLTIVGGTNTFTYVDIGYDNNTDGNTGEMTISGGTNTFKYTVILGRGIGNGTFTISGGENEFRGNLYVGYHGTGTLIISGGKNSFSNVLIAENSDFYYNYTTGKVVIYDGENAFNGYLRVGAEGDYYPGEGSMEIYGGTNTFSSVWVGYEGSTGTLSIYDGVNTFNGSLYIGCDQMSSKGRFEIAGGTNTVKGDVILGSNDNYEEGYSEMTITGGNTSFEGNITVGGNSRSAGNSFTIKAAEDGTSGTTTLLGSLTIGGEATGTMTISAGINAFEGAAYVGYNATGTLTISGGTTTFGGEVTIGRSSTGKLTLSGGTNTFVDMVLVGSEDGGAGSLIITGGTNTFENAVLVGNSSTGSVEISGGINTFDGGMVVGDIDNSASLTITGGTTSFSSELTIDSSSLSIGGTAIVVLNTQIGGSTDTSSNVVISDNAQIVLSDTFLSSAITTFDGEAEALTIIMANSITYNGSELTNENLATFVSNVISYNEDKFDLSDWTISDGVLSAVVTYIPESELFSVFFGLGAIALTATRRRKRKAA